MKVDCQEILSDKELEQMIDKTESEKLKYALLELQYFRHRDKSWEEYFDTWRKFDGQS